MLSKLEFYKLDSAALEFLSSYLHDWVNTGTEGSHSQMRPLSAGVRQGTILGPLAIIMFTNDLPAYVTKSFPKCIGAQVEVIIYADDLTALINADSQASFERATSAVKDSISLWCQANRLILNADKTQTLCFRTRGRDDHSASILGFQLDSALTWNRHITLLSGNPARVVYLLRRLSVAVSKPVLVAVYRALFESRSSYGILLWGGSSHLIMVLRQ